MKIRGGPTPVYPQGLSNVVFSWIFFRSFCRVKCWQSVRSEYLQATYGQYILSAPSKKSRPWGVFLLLVVLYPNFSNTSSHLVFSKFLLHQTSLNFWPWPLSTGNDFTTKFLMKIPRIGLVTSLTTMNIRTLPCWFLQENTCIGGVVLGNASQMICCCFCKDFCKSFLGDLNLLSFIGFQMMWFMKKWEVHFTTGPKVCYDFVR